MSRFRSPPDMFRAYPKRELLPVNYVDNSMPRQDWSLYDEPAQTRARPKVDRWKMPETPVFLSRQAA